MGAGIVDLNGRKFGGESLDEKVKKTQNCVTPFGTVLGAVTYH